MDKQDLKMLVEDLCRTFGVDDNTREHNWSLAKRKQADLLKALRNGELQIVRALP